ncbi:MAG: 50S ribosomal protein L10 [Candidatus Aenigmatarchaeota archaeon]
MLKRDKPNELAKLKEIISKYNVICILNMHKLPAKQLQKIKKMIADIAIIRMSKKSMIIKALNELERKNIKNLIEKISGEPALLLTNENPFKIFKILKENRMPASAKVGDIAKKDIVIQKGPTNLPPGPAISTLQKVGLKTSVQSGKIVILSDKVICKANEKITEDMVNVFSLLKIEPMELGLDLIAAYENGIIYDKNILDIDLDKYMNDMVKCIQNGINLSLNIGYPTKLTIKLMLQKAFVEAKSICVNANILEKNFIDEILIKAISEAKNLEEKINISS